MRPAPVVSDTLPRPSNSFRQFCETTGSDIKPHSKAEKARRYSTLHYLDSRSQHNWRGISDTCISDLVLDLENHVETSALCNFRPTKDRLTLLRARPSSPLVLTIQFTRTSFSSMTMDGARPTLSRCHACLTVLAFSCPRMESIDC